MNVHTPSPGFIWNETNTALAARLWNDGKSARSIGERIGTSKNSVISKAHRCPNIFRVKAPKASSPQRFLAAGPVSNNGNRNTGFFERRTSRDGMTLKAKRETVRREAEAYAEALEALPAPTEYDGERLAVAKELYQLEPCECRWALTNGGPFLFCAAEIKKGTSYCEPHLFRTKPKVRME